MPPTAVPSVPPTAHYGPLEALREAIAANPDPGLLAAVQELAAQLKGPRTSLVPRTDAGGLAESLDIDAILEAFMAAEKRDWVPLPGRYYFSKIANCFRKEWFKEKGYLCDHNVLPDDCETCRFDAGKAEPGHATEYWLQVLMEEVYTKGKGGAVLKDLRISKSIPAGKETVYLSGKTDMMVMGDNMVVKEFTELKTAVFWKDSKTQFGKKHGKSVPLFMAGIEEPERTSGFANLNNAVQLAVGVQILRDNGITVEQASLIYMSRERYRDYLRILLSESDVKFLAEWADAWIVRHHQNLKSKTPPAPEFCMGYECRNCPFTKACKDAGGKRVISPEVVGINARLEAAYAKA